MCILGPSTVKSTSIPGLLKGSIIIRDVIVHWFQEEPQTVYPFAFPLALQASKPCLFSFVALADRKPFVTECYAKLNKRNVCDVMANNLEDPAGTFIFLLNFYNVWREERHLHFCYKCTVQCEICPSAFYPSWFVFPWARP